MKLDCETCGESKVGEAGEAAAAERVRVPREGEDVLRDAQSLLGERPPSCDATFNEDASSVDILCPLFCVALRLWLLSASFSSLSPASRGTLSDPDGRLTPTRAESLGDVAVKVDDEGGSITWLIRLLLFVAVDSSSDAAVADRIEEATELLVELTEFRLDTDRRLKAAAE